jgi:hypothetical protein
MTSSTFKLVLATFGFFSAIANAAYLLGQEGAGIRIPERQHQFLSEFCFDCHNNNSAAADLDLQNIDTLEPSVQIEVFNRIQEQLFFGLMPPTNERQPESESRIIFSAWVREELQARHASNLDDKLQFPGYGNYVDHELLFSNTNKLPASTPSRRWLVSPQIFHERVIDLFQIRRRERDSKAPLEFYGIKNPILLPERSGVRYYDHNLLDDSHLLIMQANAKWIAEKQLTAAMIKKGLLDPQKPSNPKDRWAPAETHPAFESIVLSASSPSDEQIQAAITAQFQSVLQRSPSESERASYLRLTQLGIESAGNVDGLRQMLIAVLLHSDFLYRSEFGEGPKDEHGRLKLSPIEAAYAISYALGDRSPDSILRKAAQENRLNTANDFRREVERLLADPFYYQGHIDPTLNGKGLQSHISSHPKIVRFFRDFFGYPAALRIFKDAKRSDGIYSNPDRGSMQTPGYLVDEADRIVSHVLEQDQHVFETLLTTDRYFVYHNLDNEKSASLLRNWESVYRELKDTKWRTEPDQVAQEHAEFLKQYVDPRGVSGKSLNRHDNSLERLMPHFENTFGKGLRPFTSFPWAHGYHYWHAPLYNLSKMPGRGNKYSEDQKFDYEPSQPFPIPNRKGILTHPAWLIAHSGNFQTDPIRRGRWIREKLLAGMVPDVPITVDAKVIDDIHSTFRERVEKTTSKEECQKCHRKMNPLGFPFECFDDFGRFRTEEPLEYPEQLIQESENPNESDLYHTRSVVTTGWLDSTGNPHSDGAVRDPFEMMDRLAQSARVRQSIIRHAFRFYLGRNETLSDAQTLIDAERAYLTSDGSFKAVIVSLLASDSFLYRKPSGI